MELITQVKKVVCTGSNTFLVTDNLWNLLIGLRNLAVFYVRGSNRVLKWWGS